METCVKGLDLVEATIRSAAQDSSSETRSIGRSMYAAYVRAMPDKGQAFLRRMDTGLQEKLSQATLTYIPGLALVSCLSLQSCATSLQSCTKCQVHATCCCLFLVLLLYSGAFFWSLFLVPDAALYFRCKGISLLELLGHSCHYHSNMLKPLVESCLRLIGVKLKTSCL